MRSRSKSFFKRHKTAIVGSLVGTVVVGSIQIIIAAAVFMLLVGVVHASLSDSLKPIGYTDSVILLTLVEVLLVVLHVGIDYRAVFDEKHTDI